MGERVEEEGGGGRKEGEEVVSSTVLSFVRVSELPPSFSLLLGIQQTSRGLARGCIEASFLYQLDSFRASFVLLLLPHLKAHLADLSPLHSLLRLRAQTISSIAEVAAMKPRITAKVPLEVLEYVSSFLDELEQQLSSPPSLEDLKLTVSLFLTFVVFSTPPRTLINTLGISSS